MSNSYYTPQDDIQLDQVSSPNDINDIDSAVDTGFDNVETAIDLKAPLISPSLVTPALGTPASGVLTNCTGTAAGLTAGAVSTITGLAPDTATTAVAQPNITSVGKLTTFESTGIDDNCTAERFDLTDTILDALTGCNLRAVDGILFGSDTASANMLDDYEEGEYTATFTPTTSGTIDLEAAGNAISYTRVGRMVHISGKVTVASVASPVGTVNISVPFICRTALEGLWGGDGIVKTNFNFGTTGAYLTVGFRGSGGSTVRIQENVDNTAPVDINAASVEAGDEFTISLTYPAT